MGNGVNSIKAILFDARDTLGEVDSPGHFIPYRPSTAQLLDAVRNQIQVRIGIITNLPGDQTSEQGHRMIRAAELSQDPKTGKPLTIGDYVDDQDIITNHEASAALGHLVQKPDPEIYLYAVQRLGFAPRIACSSARTLLRTWERRPPVCRSCSSHLPRAGSSRRRLVGRIGQSATDSGRQFQAFLEHEHLLFGAFWPAATRSPRRWARSRKARPRRSTRAGG